MFPTGVYLNDAAWTLGVVFIMLVAMGMIFILISFFIQNLVIGITSAIISMVVWYATGGWWLLMETEFPDIAWVFYGIGTVSLMMLGYATIKILRPKHDEAIFENPP